MKILMISPQPFFTPRGTPFSVYYRTRTLCEMGHQVDLTTYHIGRDVRIPGLRIFRIPRVPFINEIKVGPSFPKLILDFILFWTTAWRLLKNDYDAIHAHEEGVFFCLIYKLFFPKLPLLYDMHSSLPQQLENFGFSNSGILIGIFAWLEARAIRSSRAVITICPELQNTVAALKLSTPSTLIENTLFDKIEFADGQDDPVNAVVDWSRLEGRKIVLYTGTFEQYQGIPLLLESARVVVQRQPEVVFLLVGGAPEQVAEMKALAGKLGLGDSAIFTGNLAPNTAKSFLEKADVLVSPRIRGNNTPLKIYEYLASGKPIVATRHQTHTQILTDQESMLVEADASSFAEGILTVLNDPDKQRSLGQFARKLYESQYGSEIYRSRLARVIEQLAA